jgi:serine/threonine protein kinase
MGVFLQVIVDFGLSKEENANSTVTMSGGLQPGTEEYMSPELLDPGEYVSSVNLADSIAKTR